MPAYTRAGRVVVERATYSIAASLTGIRLLSKSSFRRAFSSVSRRSLSSAMDCFFDLPSPPVRSSYGVDIILGFSFSRSDGLGKLAGLTDRSVL